MSSVANSSTISSYKCIWLSVNSRVRIVNLCIVQQSYTLFLATIAYCIKKMQGILLLAAFLLYVPPSTAQVVYHVTPTSDTRCPRIPQPCLTLNQYIEQVEEYFTPDAAVTMSFLPGTHHLCGALYISDLESVTMLGSASGQTNSLIHCTPSCGGWIEFDNVSLVRIADLNVLSCGHDDETVTHPALLLFVVPYAMFTNTSFSSNRHAGALWIFHSSVTFVGETSFTDNEGNGGGAIYAESSHVEFMGTQIFQNNSAGESSGGVIDITDVTLEVTGYSSFIDNHAVFGGVGVMDNCNVTVKGHSTFKRNSAIMDGGVFYVITGNLSFVSNQKILYGAKPQVFSVTTTVFQNNSAVSGSGGALFLRDLSSLSLNGKVLFKGNYAAHTGGAVSLYNATTAEVKGHSTFIDNHVDISLEHTDWVKRHSSIVGGESDIQKRVMSNITFEQVIKPTLTYAGGALYGDYSQLAIVGTIIFQGNSGSDVGGAVALFACSMTHVGNLQFKGNLSPRRGGAIAATHTSIEVTGSVSFAGNYAGTKGGAAYVSSSTVIVKGHTNFTDNIATCCGGAVFSEGDGILSFIGHTTFHNNTCTIASGLSRGGAMAISTGILSFRGTTVFSRNVAYIEGGAMYVRRSYATFLGNTTFVANGMHSGTYLESGGAIHAEDCSLSFSGMSTFSQNQAALGGALQVSNTVLFFYNESLFVGNSAGRRGGGLLFVRQNRTRLMYIGADAVVTFANNVADRGGAIGVTDFYTALCYSSLSLSQSDTCFFQPTDLDFRNVKLQLIFINNTASTAGSVVYGGLFDRCGFSNTVNPSQQRRNNGVYYFLRLSRVDTEDHLTSQIASDPLQVRLCINQKLSTLRQTSISITRGQIFNISLAAVGEAHAIVPATLRANFPLQTGQDAQLGEGEAIQEGGSKCTSIHYSVRSPKATQDLTIYPDGPCRDLSGFLTVEINFLPCPDGFDLSYSECVCELSLQKYTNTCNVNDETILRNGDFWISPVYDNGTYGGLIIHPHCPFDYCHSKTLGIKVGDTDTQCAFNRSGILCGKCHSSLSLALGSSRCLACSNAFISLLLLFALAGVVLVCILLSLRLTVSAGTINGLIFYANILAVNKAILFPPNDHSLLSIFIAWLNLDLGIEICFFEGLDAYGKMWLQFVFPAYIWTLVVLMIVGSYYSTLLGRLLGRNPVAVLATQLQYLRPSSFSPMQKSFAPSLPSSPSPSWNIQMAPRLPYGSMMATSSSQILSMLFYSLQPSLPCSSSFYLTRSFSSSASGF